MPFYIVIYSIALVYGLALVFTFDGVAVLVGGIALSLFSAFVWHDIVIANIVAVVSTGLATYCFNAGRR